MGEVIHQNFYLATPIIGTIKYILMVPFIRKDWVKLKLSYNDFAVKKEKKNGRGY